VTRGNPGLSPGVSCLLLRPRDRRSDPTAWSGSRTPEAPQWSPVCRSC
jgi:hypothetical protein